MIHRTKMLAVILAICCIAGCIGAPAAEEDSAGGIETLAGAAEAEGLVAAPSCEEEASFGDDANGMEPTEPDDTCEPAAEELGLGGCTCWAINRLKGWVWSRYSSWGCAAAWSYAYTACYRASDYGICSYYGCQ